MNRIEEVKDGVMRWLEKIRYREGGWGLFKYNISALRPYSSESSSIAIGILQKIGELDNIEDSMKKEAIQNISRWQDSKTGLFIDPLVKESDLVQGWGNHSWDHIWKHNTGVCENALKNLGVQAPFKHGEEVFLMFDSPPSARDYVMGLNWSNPWRVGEHLCTAIKAYRDFRGLNGGERDDTMEKAFLTFEKEILDPLTGLPNLSFGGAPHTAMAGAFKMLFAYTECERIYPYSQEAIDSTLKLQRADGAFDEGGACLNWDSLCVLREFSSQINNSYRFDDIKEAALRLEKKIVNDYAKPDGAYSFCSTKCLEVHNSIRVSKPEF